MATDTSKARERIRKALIERAFIRASEQRIVSRSSRRTSNWLFDIRRIILDPVILSDIGYLFTDSFRSEKNKIQVGGIETAAIPLITSITLFASALTPPLVCSGFFIRKSRKKDGLMSMIEGEIRPGTNIVIVDDLINSGKSVARQVEILESLGHTVQAIWVLVRFRDIGQYKYFTNKGIEIRSLFTLDDFKDALGTKNLKPHDEPQPAQRDFDIAWKFSAGNPSYFHVVPKSSPAIDDTRVYMGSDDGVMWALDQRDGSVVWSYKIGTHAKGKGIFSSPALHDGVLFFGGYDGNFYALDSTTGKKKWMSFAADWIGSSPAVARDLGLVFVGLEFGLWRKRGGIVALEVETGRKIWEYAQMPCFTHSSPLYIEGYRQVVIGSNDGSCYLFDAKTGALIWKFETGKPSEQELRSGFSAYDIKGACGYEPHRDLVICANMNGDIFFIERKSGVKRGHFKAEFGVYSTPVVHENTVLCASLDKKLYCIDLDTFTEKWIWNAGARIFATPTIIEGSIYMGANTGRLTELDPATGKERAAVIVTERITNMPAFNPKTKRFFVPTFANELYCVLRKKPG